MYTIKTPGGKSYSPSEGRCWKNTEEGYLKLLKDGRMWFGQDGCGVPRKKLYLNEREGKTSWTWWSNDEVGHTQEATQHLTKLMGKKTIFDYPKPVRLIKKMVKLVTNENDLIMDFFSGSATTAEAIIDSNIDENKRKFILIQLPEPLDEKTDGFKDGYKNISDIGKERIRRAGAKIIKENPLTSQNLDVGFRVLKVDDWNKKDVAQSAEGTKQEDITKYVENIDENRSDLDLLFGCLVEEGLELTKPIKKELIDGVDIYTYNDWLIGCFAKNVPESVIKKIAERKPRKVMFRDSSFTDSPAKINVVEIFKMHSPNTTVGVI